MSPPLRPDGRKNWVFAWRSGDHENGTQQQTFVDLFELRHNTKPPIPILLGLCLAKPNMAGSGAIQIKSTKVCIKVPWSPCTSTSTSVRKADLWVMILLRLDMY